MSATTTTRSRGRSLGPIPSTSQVIAKRVATPKRSADTTKSSATSDVSPDQIAALGAFLSGIGSVLSAAWYVKRQRKIAEQECDKRLAEYDRALREGIEIARSHDDDDAHER
jgi:hypothetical protein